MTPLVHASPHVWWRDDDAGPDDPRLDRLIELAARHGAPLALAVVPARLEDATRAKILAAPHVRVLQHGWSHADHSGGRGKRIELGGERPVAEVLADLARGRELLAHAFGERFVPVLVPPWNRIGDDVAAALPADANLAISTFAAHRSAAPIPHRNVHLDGIVWRDGGRALDERGWTDGFDRLVAAGVEPVGLLTHHLVMDEPAFAALDRFLSMRHEVRDHWLAADRWLGEGR